MWMVLLSRRCTLPWLPCGSRVNRYESGNLWARLLLRVHHLWPVLLVCFRFSADLSCAPLACSSPSACGRTPRTLSRRARDRCRAIGWAARPVRRDTSERSSAVIVADDAFFLRSLHPIPEDSPPLRMSEAFQHIYLLLQGRQQKIRILTLVAEDGALQESAGTPMQECYGRMPPASAWPAQPAAPRALFY
ncbi:unnamed protein product [Vitrella brassicaformis CCMP3155]|uniref:Uncharacterized protein n=1 Tax=Vitrella brassicaformis (strain CCMP3155) TaxID=1169540 RepID=A0A0G4GW39_VITBC|nr:unnamed protein product [Vitrella brassicaformis CCMP3155]|eukprot:CEM35176.1 unnamed protein product [Vitrella brassicaformis CCMP3155]